MKEGLEKGLKTGLEKGLAEGEHKKAIETAKNMLSDNLPINVIAKYTGLSIDVLNKLQSNKS